MSLTARQKGRSHAASEAAKTRGSSNPCLVMAMALASEGPRRAAGRLAFWIAGAYLAVGMVHLMLISGGAPFVPTPDPGWRVRMSETGGFLAVTGILVYFLSFHGVRELLTARREAARSKVELVHRLAVVAEWKDDTIGGHNYRIARCASIIAGQLGLSDRQCELVFHGAVLHDIGKVGMPDYLLRKNGAFTPEERGLMERHTVLGAALLEGSDDELLNVARTIALTHHENWDGTGYPNGLIGEQIPIEGRIVAVCDVLDALLSRRPYKEPWDDEHAVEFVVEQSGRKFDPSVVTAMKQTFAELVAIRDEVPGDPWVAWHAEPDRLVREGRAYLETSTIPKGS